MDLWIAPELPAQGAPAAEVEAVLGFGSPDFPRRHGNPRDYLGRTLAGAAFPAQGALCRPLMPETPLLPERVGPGQIEDRHWQVWFSFYAQVALVDDAGFAGDAGAVWRRFPNFSVDSR